MTKSHLIKTLTEMLRGKEQELNTSIRFTKESREAESKSSAGDKYETGREMIQAEIDKQEAQLHKTRLLLNELSKIDVKTQYKQVEFGSLVITDAAMYLMSVGLGKIPHESGNCYAISPASPIGQLLLHKREGDSIVFNNKKIKILEVR